VVVLKSLENLLCSFLVFCIPGRVNEQVIHIDDEPSFSDEVAKEVVHKCLEHGRGVAEAKEHDSWFEETKGGDERGLPAVFRANQHVVVAPTYVHLGKDT
jgi:hypothetical protein